MAITISGANNVDKILATDGVLDSISGFNVVGVMTAGTFDVTGKTTTGHLNIGSNIQLGNAGIITATTLIGNVTGNVNATSNLLLQIGGSEKFRVASSGQLGIGGANYGSAGQVLTSGGSGAAASWSTIASDKITEGNTEAEVVDTGSDGHFKVTTEGSERLRITPNGIVNIGDVTNNTWIDSTLKVRKDQNAVTKIAVRNENQGSSASAAIVVNSYGNSWMFDCGSAAKNSNALTIRVDATASSNQGTERFRLTTAGAIGLNGANYGSSGQVLTSQGSSSAPTWSTITGTTINNNADNRIITGSGTANTLNGESGLLFDGTQLQIGGDSGFSGTWGLEVYNTSSNEGTALIGGLQGAQLQIRDLGSSECIKLAANGQASIQSLKAGDPMVFFTTPSGGSVTERLRIASDGKVNIGGSARAKKLTVVDTASQGGANSGTITDALAMFYGGKRTVVNSDLTLDETIIHIKGQITDSGTNSSGDHTTNKIVFSGRRATGAQAWIEHETNWVYNTQNAGSTLKFHTAEYSSNGGDAPIERLHIRPDGRIGINATNTTLIKPTYTLDLGGNDGSADTSEQNTLRIRCNNGGTAIRVGSGGGSSRVTLLRVDGDGNPSGANGCTGGTDAGAFGASLVYHGDRSGNENSFAVYMDQTNNASQIEAFNIRQNGDYLHSGSNYSDRDQKENITAISGTALDKITQLSPKTWNWKPEYHDIPTDRIFAGFIAQEVQPHIPSIVTGTDGQGDMALDYQGLLAWTIKAVTELTAKVETLEQDNIALRARVTNLEGN